jgi:hypothetical protein
VPVIQVVLIVRYIYQTFTTMSPLEAQHARQRQRATATAYQSANADAYAQAEAYAVPSDSDSPRSTASAPAGLPALPSSIAGDRYDYQRGAGAEGHYQDARMSPGGRANARQFVGTHITGVRTAPASAGGYESELSEEIISDGVIDSINADLLRSRERSLQTSSATSRTPSVRSEFPTMSTARQRPSQSPAARVSAPTSAHSRTTSLSGVSYRSSQSSARSPPEDWNIGPGVYSTGASPASASRRRTGSRSTRFSETPRSTSVFDSPARAPARASAQVGSPDTPYSQRSSRSHSQLSQGWSAPSDFGHESASDYVEVDEPEEGEEEEEVDPVDRVFQHDVLNMFFPYLRKKQPDGAQGQSGDPSRKDR